jgi:hypothetical protein
MKAISVLFWGYPWYDSKRGWHTGLRFRQLSLQIAGAGSLIIPSRCRLGDFVFLNILFDFLFKFGHFGTLSPPDFGSCLICQARNHRLSKNDQDGEMPNGFYYLG